jgi:hypothetical protein
MTFLAGQTLTAAALNDAIDAAVPLKAVKTANETVNNSTTYQNDDHLVLTPTISKTYRGRLFVIYSATNTIDAKIRFTYPTGATVAIGAAAPMSSANETDREGDVLWSASAAATSPTADIVLGTHNSGGGSAILTCAQVMFTLVMSSTAGNLQLQWAQNAAVATDLVFYAGSWLELWEQ